MSDASFRPASPSRAPHWPCLHGGDTRHSSAEHDEGRYPAAHARESLKVNPASLESYHASMGEPPPRKYDC